MNIDSRVFQSIRLTAGCCCVFLASNDGFLTCHHVSFDLFFCEVDNTRVPFHPWQKYEWSCCQTGTEVLVVSAASAGRMSKRSVWINDFSRGPIVTDRQMQGHCSVSLFSFYLFFYKGTFWRAGYKITSLLSQTKDWLPESLGVCLPCFRQVGFVCPNCMKRKFIFNQLQSHSVSRERQLVCSGISKEVYNSHLLKTHFCINS